MKVKLPEGQLDLYDAEHLDAKVLVTLKQLVDLAYANRMAAYIEQCDEDGEVACNVITGHIWVIPEDDVNSSYCENCGCVEY